MAGEAAAVAMRFGAPTAIANTVGEEIGGVVNTQLGYSGPYAGVGATALGNGAGFVTTGLGVAAVLAQLTPAGWVGDAIVIGGVAIASFGGTVLGGAIGHYGHYGDMIPITLFSRPPQTPAMARWLTIMPSHIFHDVVLTGDASPRVSIAFDLRPVIA